MSIIFTGQPQQQQIYTTIPTTNTVNLVQVAQPVNNVVSVARPVNVRQDRTVRIIGDNIIRNQVIPNNNNVVYLNNSAQNVQLLNNSGTYYVVQ